MKEDNSTLTVTEISIHKNNSNHNNNIIENCNHGDQIRVNIHNSSINNNGANCLNHNTCNNMDDRKMETEVTMTVVNPAIDDDDMGLTSESSNISHDDLNESNEIMSAAMREEVTAELASAGWSKEQLNGPMGMATASAICSGKKRKRPHSFEANPSMRKRQHNRLLRKLRQTIDEFSTRVGQQAVVLVATPGKEISGFRCFGARPLEDVLKNLKTMIMEELEAALAQRAPSPIPHDPNLYELPPLVLDGTPTPVERMTQAQLRAFIPLMLKYSTGRGKPGWGRETTRPNWWPDGLPWANVRMDARSEEDKQKVSWTKALRQIVINCYKFHGREDLLPVVSDDEDGGKLIDSPDNSLSPSSNNQINNNNVAAVATTSTIASTCSTINIINNSHHGNTNATSTTTTTMSHHHHHHQYGSNVLQTINNSDGTLSIIHVDPNNPIITMPDGTTAHVQGVTLHSRQNDRDSTTTVHSLESLADVATSQNENVTSVDLLNNVTEATLNQSGQIILTGDDGHGYPVSISGVLTVPVSGGSMYQTVVANIQHINNDIVHVTPLVHVPKLETDVESIDNNGGSNDVETITVAPHQVIAVSGSSDSPLLRVISIKDAHTMKALGVNISADVEGDDAPTITGR